MKRGRCKILILQRPHHTVIITIGRKRLIREQVERGDGDPVEFLRNLNNHMTTARENQLIFIEKTGHTYPMKHQEVADNILRQLQEWRKD